MRTRRGMGVFVLVALTMVLAILLTRAPEALADVEVFRVKNVELEGARFLTLEQVEELLDVSPEASVWDDLEPLARKVRAHGLVREARVRRRLPSTLLVQVAEREPAALLPTPVLTPVDEHGRVLPIDPARFRVDLPIVQPVREPWTDGGSLAPGEIRLLAGEAARLAGTDPGLLGSVSELAIDSEGDILLRLSDPEVALHYRPPVTAARLREGLRVMAHAAGRRPGTQPRVVDLRFEDQVVVRFSHPNQR